MAFLLSILFRVTTWGDVFRGGTPRVPPFDDQYHALRIVYSALRFPAVLEFDPDRGVSGAYCPWPPLYDLAAGGLARILGGMTEATILARAVWFPVLAGSLFLGFLSYAAVRRFGALAGGATVLALVFSVPLIPASQLGSIDHHFLEAPLLLGVALALGAAARAASPGAAVRSGGLLGAALSLALFVESAFLFAAALCFLALLLGPRRDRHPPLAGAIGFGLAAAAVSAYRVSRPPGFPGSEWYLGTPHATALAAAAVALAVAVVLARRGFDPIAARLLAFLLGGASAAAIPGALAAYADGTLYFGGDPSLAAIAELQPLFWRSLSPVEDVFLLGGAGLLALIFVVDAFRAPAADRRAQAFLVLGYLAVAISSRRFLATAIPLLVLASGAAVAARAKAATRGPALAAAGILGIPALLGAWLALRHPVPTEVLETASFERAALFLARRPEAHGRVLGPFSWGHLLHRLGGRPVLVDPFGAMPDRRLFEDALAATLTTREDHLAAWCRSRDVRFIVLENPLMRITRQAEAVGLSAPLFLRPSGGPDNQLAVTRFAQATFWWRAYFDRGAALPPAGSRGAPFRFFRLAYADPQLSTNPPPFGGPLVQIWELSGR